MALPQINLPKFKTTIPSTGKDIEYVPYTVGQEKALLTASESNSVSDVIDATKRILSECYVGLNLDELTSYDVDYLFLQLRIQSVSSTSELYFRSMVCGKTGKECEKSVKLNINLNEVTVQKYNEETNLYDEFKPIKYKNGGIPIDITDEVGVIMKHPGFKEQEEFGKIENGTEDDLIKLCIVSVYDNESVYTRDEFTDKELSDFYSKITPEKLTPCLDFIRNVPKIRYETQFKCKECGFVEQIKFEDFASFFG